MPVSEYGKNIDEQNADVSTRHFKDLLDDISNDELGHLRFDDLKGSEVDITEDEREFVVDLLIPGLEEEDILVDTDGDRLLFSINPAFARKRASTAYDPAPNEENFIGLGYLLPDEVEADEIYSTYENERLRVVLPKIASTHYE
jgi:HSP20 family protein